MACTLRLAWMEQMKRSMHFGHRYDEPSAGGLCITTLVVLNSVQPFVALYLLASDDKRN